MKQNALIKTSFGGFDAFQLKMIALICMLIDHVAEFLVPALPIPGWFHVIGRVAAPVFFFLVAWSFFYTGNRLRFMMRLYLWNLGMQVGNVLLEAIFYPRTGVQIVNGIFGSMFYMVFFLYFIERCRDARSEGNGKKFALSLGLVVLVPLLTSAITLLNFVYGAAIVSAGPVWQSVCQILMRGALPSPLFVEGSFLYVFWGVGLYYFRERPISFTVYYILTSIVLGLFTVQIWMLLALPLLLLYNHERGVRPMKYLFYAFYPAHVWILYVLGAILLL